MFIEKFDCFCGGEKVKNITEVELPFRGEKKKYKILHWYAVCNCHFFCVEREDGIKEYYFNECVKEAKENNCFSKIKSLTDKHSKLWVICKDEEVIRQIENLFFDLWGEEMEIMDNTAFCRLAKTLMAKNLELPRRAVISGLLPGTFAKNMDAWVYISALNTLFRECQNTIIIATKDNFIKEINIKEVKYNDIL